MNAVRAAAGFIHLLMHEFKTTCERNPFYTAAIEALMNAVVAALTNEWLRGLIVQGLGRDGKSQAVLWLVTHRAWLPFPGIVRRITIPNTRTKSDSAFWNFVLDQWSVGRPRSSRPGLDALMQVFLHLVGELALAQGSLIVIFIDEAQRLTDDEWGFLATLDELCMLNGIHLMMVFVDQVDAFGPVAQSVSETARFPAHIVGRYGRRSHQFTGLALQDLITVVADNLDKDRGRESENCFAARFAPEAFRRGHRMALAMPGLIDYVTRLRDGNGLSKMFLIPLDTGMAMCANLMVQSATPGFAGFQEAHFAEAVDSCGYLRLEFCRVNRTDPPAGAL